MKCLRGLLKIVSTCRSTFTALLLVKGLFTQQQFGETIDHAKICVSYQIGKVCAVALSLPVTQPLMVTESQCHSLSSIAIFPRDTTRSVALAFGQKIVSVALTSTVGECLAALSIETPPCQGTFAGPGFSWQAASWYRWWTLRLWNACTI